MRARFINEFERTGNARKGLSIGVEGLLDRLTKDWKENYKDYYSKKANPTPRKLLEYAITKNRWGDVEMLASLPNKLFPKKVWRGAIHMLMDYPNKVGEEELIRRVDFLLEQGADLTIHNWGAFKRACGRGMPKLVEKFIELGADPNASGDIPIKKVAESIDYNPYNKDLWDTIRVLAKHSKY